MSPTSADPGREHVIARGAMLYDASRMDQPDAAAFEPEHWRARGALESVPGGRGTVAFIRDGSRRWVLRHYRRGGLVERFLDDRYLYTGAASTRAYAEWHLLWQLRDWDLPVPAPVAACYRRSGIFYRADLITEELPTRLTLAAALAAGPLPEDTWRAVGRCVAALHERGVEHADLNAHNLLLGPDAAVYVLDFDCGRIRPRGDWERGVLARLERSLLKVTRGLPAGRYGAEEWRWLVEAAMPRAAG
ncbi:MAG: 3-deoxy-D-manno-octulosonic acid kinase [Steroidobacteraceae bacterium]